MDTVVNIGGNARIFATGLGLYFENAGVINITGPASIIGSTGICMRGGTLNIPRDANPTIIGLGKYKPYDPKHTIKDGSDYGKNLNLGHALLVECNGNSYGGRPVSADIRSGTFISYENTAIGSYGIKKEPKDAAEYYEQRITRFTDGI